MRRVRSHNNGGFTLIEIIIAVMILAVSLITLLGLQSSATQVALQTRNKQEAMLTARAIMSAIEYAGSAVQNQAVRGTASEVAGRFLNKEAVVPIIAQEKRVPLTANLVIAYWPLEGLPKDALQKITLTISWGKNPDEELTTYYFIPAKHEEK